MHDYIDKFCEFIDQLQAYSGVVDPLYYTTRFIDGLRDDIKSNILVQRPPNFDTACCLALLQEENIILPVKEAKKYDSSFSRPYARGPLPLPRPPDHAKTNSVSDNKSKAGHKSHSIEEKMASLTAYRMVRGLCKKCGKKWNKTHQCAAYVQLNVLQEVWDLFEQEESDTVSKLHHEQLLMALSKAAATGKEDPKTLKIRGSIQNIEILVLIDSGSSNSFISELVAGGLTGVSYSVKPLNVRDANGKIIQSTAEMLNVEWYL
jgi:hypothetical protein